MERLYCDLMLLASGVIAALAVAIIGVKIPSRQEFGKLRIARATLAASFITLSILNFICYFTGYDESLDRLNTLIVAAFQALLLTGTLLVFIRPDVVTGKWVGLQTAVICILSALLYCVLFIFPDIYPTFFHIGAALLVLQLIFYSVRFFKSQKMTINDLNNYYADDFSPRLSGIRAGFILMLIIGAMSLCTLATGPWFYAIFVPAYLICYTIVAICMIRYVNSTSFILQAIGNPEEEAPSAELTQEPAHKAQANIPEHQLIELRNNIASWVAAGEYRRRDVPYKEILETLNTDAATMRVFMKSENGMDFRSWRNKLRLQEACQMLSGHPEMNAEQISEHIGYSDSSNFHTDFRKFTGMSASEWRRTRTKTDQLN